MKSLAPSALSTLKRINSQIIAEKLSVQKQLNFQVKQSSNQKNVPQIKTCGDLIEDCNAIVFLFFFFPLSSPLEKYINLDHGVGRVLKCLRHPTEAPYKL